LTTGRVREDDDDERFVRFEEEEEVFAFLRAINSWRRAASLEHVIANADGNIGKHTSRIISLATLFVRHGAENSKPS
jgi:hypothetical protein